MEEKETEMNNNRDEISEEVTSLDKAKVALKETVSWLISLALAAIVAYILAKFILFKALVPTESMVNTIMKDDRIIAWQPFVSISRGDIVIFPALEYSGEDALYVKRVIGLPGETVEIHDNTVYINGVALKEDYLAEKMSDDSFGPYVVPEGRYFLLGDNRNYSRDARYWEEKYVKKEDIVAKALFRFWPGIKWYKKPKYQ